MMDDIWDHIRTVSEWLDANRPATGDIRVLQVLKLSEEVGEAAQAVIGATGQNPRKGVTHTWEDVELELCDVALAALVALETITAGEAADVFAKHVTTRHERLLKLTGRDH